jgi:hypothetical protein
LDVTKQLVRAVAALVAIGCLVLSARFLLEIGFLGFAIGGWTGLKGYEKSLSEARAQSQAAMLRLVAVQIFGGASAFLALRRTGIGVAWLALFLAGFPIVTYVACAIVFWTVAALR